MASEAEVPESLNLRIELMPRLAAAFAALLLAASPVVTTASASQDAPPAQPAQQGQAQGHHPIPKPTNLQVLPKNIAVPDLIALMRGYTGALGVECGFCHASDPNTHRPNFASDANPDKAIARIMITMTQEINAKYLSKVKDPDASPADKTVTCGTCHRGNSMPAPFAPVASMGAHHDQSPAPDKKPQ
jgi:hypothetical protein